MSLVSSGNNDRYTGISGQIDFGLGSRAIAVQVATERPKEDTGACRKQNYQRSGGCFLDVFNLWRFLIAL